MTSGASSGATPAPSGSGPDSTQTTRRIGSGLLSRARLTGALAPLCPTRTVTEQQVLRIDYVSSIGERTHRDIEPTLFANTRGTWYLIAWCRLGDAVRWFAMDRICKAAVTNQACSGHMLEEVGVPPVTAASVSVD